MIDFDPNFEEKILKFLKEEIGFENYGDALDRGLTRIQPIFKDLIKNNQAKVIIIGGTNGKGEVSYNVSQKLRLAKKQFGLWSSPHILSIRERFIFNGEVISYKDLEKNIEHCYSYLVKNNYKLSFYEFLFYVFLSWINKKKVGFLILEVGLGGRLDATNLFDADISAIVSISRDHQEYLGSTLREILFEKLAITRKKQILIHGVKQKYLQGLIKKYCRLNQVFEIGIFDQQLVDSQDNFHDYNYKISNLISIELGLPRFEHHESQPILRNWKFSFEKCDIYLSGSHNIEGIRQLGKDICKKGIKPDLIVYSSSRRSPIDISHILKSLLAYSNKNCKILVTSFDHIKSIDFETLRGIAESINSDRIGVIETWEEAYKYSQSRDKKRVLFTGSYYFISNILHDIHITKRLFSGEFKTKNF